MLVVTVERAPCSPNWSGIICSAEFRGAERRARLLHYLVEKAITGETVKGYAIGVDVFDKSANCCRSAE
jgi:hypothetical protein